MTREGTRPFAAFFAAALVAALLAACGGSDSDSSGSAEATTTGGSPTSGSTAGNAGGSQDSSPARQDDAQDRNQPDQDRSQARQDGDGGSAPQNVETPLEVSGGGSEQFRTKGGDNSIQEYGDEGDESELQEVAEVVHSFYVARAEEKWDTACSYLAKSNIEQLEEIGAQSPRLKDAGCGPILQAFTRPLPAASQREITTVDAGSFRREGDQGFLVYFGAGKTPYAMPLRDEGGTWKVMALSASALG